MLIGTSQTDITPKPGVELSGFAARTQPSIGMLDPLYAKAIYLTEASERLLWIHCDLLEFDRETVLGFRRWARSELDLPENRVLLSATHTHSGPCTARLKEVGAYDAGYMEVLSVKLRDLAQKAMTQVEPCGVVTAEGRLNLAEDRRKTVTAHLDPRVAGVGFKREDGSFAAVIVNFPMHPVALGSTNRHISADVPGQAALSLAGQLSGAPLVLMTNGACANLNPPCEDVEYRQIKAWGDQIASTIGPLLKGNQPLAATKLQVISRILPLPLDTLDADGIHTMADKALRFPQPLAEWGDKYRRAVHAWRESLLLAARGGRSNDHSDAELFAIALGDAAFVALNGEVFSHFADWLRQGEARKVYVVGYANGSLGYLPTRAAYAEGGYEVDVAHFFQGHFRLKAGGLETLAQEAKTILRELGCAPRQAEATVGPEASSNAPAVPMQ